MGLVYQGIEMNQPGKLFLKIYKDNDLKLHLKNVDR